MYIRQCTTTLTQSLFCHLKDALGKVGKLGNTMVRALGTDGSSDPMAPQQYLSSDFSVEAVSFLFLSLSTVIMITLEAKQFVEGTEMKPRMRIQTGTEPDWGRSCDRTWEVTMWLLWPRYSGLTP